MPVLRLRERRESVRMKTIHYQHTETSGFTWCGLRAANWDCAQDWHEVTCTKCFRYREPEVRPEWKELP